MSKPVEVTVVEPLPIKVSATITLAPSSLWALGTGVYVTASQAVLMKPSVLMQCEVGDEVTFRRQAEWTGIVERVLGNGVYEVCVAGQSVDVGELEIIRISRKSTISGPLPTGLIIGKPASSAKRERAEVPCSGCGRKNDVGVRVCWCCGNTP